METQWRLGECVMDNVELLMSLIWVNLWDTVNIMSKSSHKGALTFEASFLLETLSCS